MLSHGQKLRNFLKGPGGPLLTVAILIAGSVSHHLLSRNMAEAAGSEPLAKPRQIHVLSKETKETILACATGVKELSGLISIEQFTALEDYLARAPSIEGVQNPQVTLYKRRLSIKDPQGKIQTLEIAPTALKLAQLAETEGLDDRIESFLKLGRLKTDERVESRFWSRDLHAEVESYNDRIVKLKLSFNGGLLVCDELNEGASDDAGQMDCHCL